MWYRPKPDRDLVPALEALSARDPDIAEAYAVCGLPPRRRRRPGFVGLARIVTAQQVSAGAARAIFGRLSDLVRPFTAEALLLAGEDDLRAAGLSRAKVVYLRALAADVVSGRIDLKRLKDMDDAAAISHLCQAKGIGRWSAELYLLFSLRRPDIWPAGDLAVQVALKKLKRLRKHPDEKRMDRIAEAWRPHRSAAALFLWHYYRHPGVP